MVPDLIEQITTTKRKALIEKYSLNDDCKLLQYTLEKVIEERCDEFDYQLEEEGFKIIEREFKRVATSIYNYQVIVFK